MVLKHKTSSTKEFLNQCDQNAWERKLRRQEYLLAKRLRVADMIVKAQNNYNRFNDKDFWARQLEYFRTELHLIDKELQDVSTVR